jgi:hypothetical protein
MQQIAVSVPSDPFGSGWRRLLYAMRPSPQKSPSVTAGDREAPSAVDPIALTIMAVNRLGAARMRAVLYGRPVTVAAPDLATAEIFRAALSQMAKERPTDRLISVELIADTARDAVLA